MCFKFKMKVVDTCFVSCLFGPAEKVTNPV